MMHEKYNVIYIKIKDNCEQLKVDLKDHTLKKCGRENLISHLLNKIILEENYAEKHCCLLG